MAHKATDFKENQWVICTQQWCQTNGGKKINTSTVTSKGKYALDGFPGWNNFKTVLDACKKNPSYFTIVDEVINDYEIY